MQPSTFQRVFVEGDDISDLLYKQVFFKFVNLSYLFIVPVKVVVFPPKSTLHVIFRQSLVMLQSPGRSIDLHSSLPAKPFAIFSKSSSNFLVAESVKKRIAH